MPERKVFEEAWDSACLLANQWHSFPKNRIGPDLLWGENLAKERLESKPKQSKHCGEKQSGGTSPNTYLWKRLLGSV